MARTTKKKVTPLPVEQEHVGKINTVIGVFNTLHEKEPQMAEAIMEAIKHIGNTFIDKYETKAPLSTKGLIYFDSDLGKGYNVGNASKYLQRYLTTGYDKSSNPKDLTKAAHYVLFELGRLIKNDKMKPHRPR